jgi:hypothetical protein
MKILVVTKNNMLTVLNLISNVDKDNKEIKYFTDGNFNYYFDSGGYYIGFTRINIYHP